MGSAEGTSNDQEAVSAPTTSAVQQSHTSDLSAAAERQPLHAAKEADHQAPADSHDAEDAHASCSADQQTLYVAVAGQAAEAPPEGADEQFGLSGPHFNDDDPSNPDGKLMSLLMG